jgi:hypothetical protein
MIPALREFSQGLQKLKSQYVYKYHAKYKLSGPIWRGRYQSLLIESEPYLYACGQYIENNPVKAGLVKSSEQWEYSSMRHYRKMAKDALVDGYGGEIVPQLPKQVDLQDEKFFEKGVGIGSGFFRFQLKETLKQNKQPC